MHIFKETADTPGANKKHPDLYNVTIQRSIFEYSYTHILKFFDRLEEFITTHKTQSPSYKFLYMPSSCRYM